MTARQGWKVARGVITALGLSALLAGCKQEIAVGEDRSRELPAASARAPEGDKKVEIEEKGVTPRSDQKMIPGLDQGHTPGPADTTVPLKPGVPPLDNSGAARTAPPEKTNP